MNKWGVRILGLVMLLLFALVFAHLRSQLVKLQHQQQEQHSR
jgi:hypothetical protein